MSTTRETKSSIWEHFTKVPRPDLGERKFIVSCKYCGVEYKFTAGSGYGTFKRHLNSKHPTEAGVDNRQQQISGYANTQPLFRFSDNTYREYLARCVAVEHLSFNFGEKFGFNQFIQQACAPQAKRVPRTTLTRDIKNLYKKEKADLKQIFKKFNGRVHIGSDIWSDHWQTHSYMGVTCHWIDNEWTIQKRIIAFRVFDDRHTANNISRILKQILEEYYLLNKVFSIGFDNAAANTASIIELENVCRPSFGGQFFHIRCACHVLNLCVQDGLKSLTDFLTPIRNAIHFLWTHHQAMKGWFQFCKEHNKKGKRFPRDVPTRWNSTYQLLSESYNYKDLLCEYIAENFPFIPLYPNEWIICKKILDILKVFNDATYTLSGVYYPTAHLFIIECVNIVEILQENENDPDLGDTITAMRNKWLAYYKNIPLIYLVASVFDPRIRLDQLSEYLNIYYQYLGLHDQIDIRRVIENLKTTIIELYNEFCRTYNLGDSSSSQPSTTDSRSSNKISKGYEMLMHAHKKFKRIEGSNSEIENYLTVSFEFDDSTGTKFSILDWWRRHSNQYPVLALIAKQIFATPCSTVAVEQAFSAGGTILDETRSRLTPESVEAQACLDDWTRAKYRQQEINQAADAFFEGEDTTGTETTGSSD